VKFFTEVVVEPAVEQRVGAGGAHADHVADGVAHQHALGDRRALHVRVQVEEVQRQPGDAEDDRDADQQAVGPLHPPAALHLPLGGGRLHGHHGDAALQLVVDPEVGHRDDQDGHQVLDNQK